MSRVPLYPQEEETFSNTGEEEKLEYKRPEFILIDDRDGEDQHLTFENDQTGAFEEDSSTAEQVSAGKNSLRFICLLGFIFCAIFGLGMLLGAIAFSALSIVTLFLNKNFNATMGSFWTLFLNTFVAGFGFTLGMFSPVLGLGLLTLYFSLSSEVVEEDILRKVIRRASNQL